MYRCGCNQSQYITEIFFILKLFIPYAHLKELLTHVGAVTLQEITFLPIHIRACYSTWTRCIGQLRHRLLYYNTSHQARLYNVYKKLVLKTTKTCYQVVLK